MNKVCYFILQSVAFSLLVFLSQAALAQAGKITGTVSEAGEPIVGATVRVQGTTMGTITDIDGNYTLKIDPGTYTFVASFVGYAEQISSVTISPGANTLDFELEAGIAIDELVVLGTRASNRTSTDTPVPVDVINVDELSLAAPQTQLNQILHYTAPSFSSNTQTISDGTDHIDPASLRGLGPDQVLVLMNGKRRHNSSLINVNGTFGRGSVGTDLNAIPAAAIGRIEVLRDGAAAQYGSDAIAGVINLGLKSDVNELKLTINSGANFTKNASPQKDIDGETVEIGANYGLPLGDKGGFINLTGSFDYRGWTNRMQDFSGQIFNGYNSVEWVANNAGADLSALSTDDIKNFAQDVDHFSNELKGLIMNAPDVDSLQSLLNFDATTAELAARGQVSSDYNMRVGQSEVRGGKFFANMAIPLSNGFEVYSFGGISYRDGLSGCFYRLPHQNRTYTPTYINGFLPKINSNISDKSLAAGIRGQVNGWKIDFSNAWGSNDFNFRIKNTNNATLGNASTAEFNAGGHSFTQNTSNLDLSHYYNMDGIEGINVAFGGEYRLENFTVDPGSETSYGNYDHNGLLVNGTTPDASMVTDFFGRSRPSGAQCFAGFLPSNEIDANRSSVAGYADVEVDISKSFLVSGALRYENYSDFGSTFNYKLAARYKVGDNITLRAAHSTGFRAPSLHQIHFSRTSTIFVTTDGVTTAQEVGVFSNTSRAAKLLGIPELSEETSQNFSGGITAKLPTQGIKITVDGYLVDIDNRVILTGRFEPGDNPDLQQIFTQAQADAAAFFANAIDTRSYGVDVVVAHSMLLGGGDIKLQNNLAATYSKTKRVGDIHASPLLEEAELTDTYFNEESRIYLEEAVPRTKVILGNNLTFKNLNVYLRNTFFGPTTEATNGVNSDPTVDYTYSGKVLTDLSVGYNFTDNLSLTVGANNLFDIYPDEADESFLSSGRFIYSRRSPQFSFNGRYLFARLAFNLK